MKDNKTQNKNINHLYNYYKMQSRFKKHIMCFFVNNTYIIFTKQLYSIN